MTHFTTHFAELSYDQQVACLETLAHEMLSAYGLTPADYSLKCVSHWQNTTFRVTVSAGSQQGRYALRINRPISQNLTGIRSEMQWLAALSRETDLGVPSPVANQAAEWVSTAGVACVGDPRHGVLLRWVEGKFLDTELTPRQVEQVGAFMGKLHRHSAQFSPPDGFWRRELEWDGQMEDFFSQRVARDNPSMTPHIWEVFEAVRQQTESVMRGLGKDSTVYGLIHNDIYQNNLLFEGDLVRCIDFDNCGYAHYLLDVAVTLAQLRHHADYAEKRTAFFRGYRTHRPLSTAHEALLDHFIAARIMLLALYFASQLENEKMRAAAPQFIANSLDDLQRWLKVGRFRD